MSNIKDFVIENGVLKKYTGIGDNIIIPNIVTVIDCEAFCRCTNIISITIPDSVTSIGDGAFWGCKSLTSITIPDSVTSIGDNAFWGCENLTSITIPDSVSTIGNEAFKYCKGLTYIKIPDSVTTIGDGAFSCCENLTSITIPDNVSILGNEAFKHCEGLADEDGFVVIRNILYDYYGDGGNISIPNGVTTINNHAFYACKNLVSLTIPDSVTSIGDSAFSECENLSSIIVPNSITSIGENAFEDCKKLSDFTFPSKLKLVSKSCFENSGLTSVKLTESIEFIDDWAFAGIRATEVEIPKTVKSIGLSIFAQVPNITVYDSMDVDAKSAEDFVDDTNGEWNGHVGSMGLHYWRGCVEMACHSYWYDHTITVKSVQTGDVKYRVWMCGEGESREVWCSLASSWGKNAEFAFTRFDNKIFSKIKKLENKMRAAIYRLTDNYNLSDESKSIYLSWLKRNSTRVLTKLIEIGDLKTIIFLSNYDILSKNNIEKMIEFANTYGKVEIVNFLLNYKAENSHLLEKTKKIKKDEIDKDLGPKEKSITEWKKTFTIDDCEKGAIIKSYKGRELEVVIPEKIGNKRVVEIGPLAFSSTSKGISFEKAEVREKIVSIIIPNGITKIDWSAFSNCSNLESIKIPDSVSVIGTNVFRGCAKLTSITISDNVSSIGMGCFIGTKYYYTKENWENGVLYIGNHLIEADARRLFDSYSIRKGTKTIAEKAFSGCIFVEEILIPEGLKSIDGYAFAGCKLLKSISIPESVVQIGENAFAICPNLVIHAPAGSYAEEYAKENNIKFIAE